MAFYQKYRSKTFGEMIGQDHVTKTLLESVKSDRFVHAYLLTGPRGIGKTSTARLLAKAINCEKVAKAKKDGKPTTGEPCNECESCRDINQGAAIDVIEIDAASNTGVDNIRELIEKSKLLPSKLKYKVYIIDEVHMLSKGAFNALLKTLEEPPKHVVFILATTETQKIPATILSRAQRFDFKRAQKSEIVENLKRIAAAEKIKIDAESLDLIAVLASGAHRDALSLLEQAASAGEDISISQARKILGVAEVETVHKFIGAIFSTDPEEGLKIAHGLYVDGADLTEFNRNIIETLRRILVFQVAGESLLEETEENIKTIKYFSGRITREKLVEILDTFIAVGGSFKDTVYPILPLEMAIVKSTAETTEAKGEKSNPSTGSGQEVESNTGGQGVESSRLKVQSRTGESQVEGEKLKVKSETGAGVISMETVKSRVRQDPSPHLVHLDGGLSSSLSDEVAHLRVDDAMAQDDNSEENQTNRVDSVLSVSSATPPLSLPSVASAKDGHSDSATAPVPVVYMTKDIWEQIINLTKKQNATLAALLRDAKPEAMTDNVLTVGVKFKFHKERISEAKHAEMLSKIVSEVMGNNCRIVCKLDDHKTVKKESAPPENLTEVAAEVFEVE